MVKEFKEIGKKVPYTVPDGFFEGITKLTLEKARKRVEAGRTRKLIIQWMAAAAIVTGVVFAGIRLLSSSGETAPPAIAIAPLEIPAQEGIIKPDPETVIIPRDSDVHKNTGSRKSLEIVPSPDDWESMDELLASIPDKELLDWATLVGSDPFFAETETNEDNEDN